MSATWSFPGGTAIRLTLDGTGSGAKTSTRTFTGLTPSTLYTFYLAVNPSVVAIGAFLEAVGGDTTVADITGSQTLRARTVTNGSGEATVRFGAQSIEAAPTSEGSYPLDNPNQASIEADGFTVTLGAGAFTFGYAVGLTGYATGIRITQTGSGADAVLALALALAPSSAYTVRLKARALQDAMWFNNLTLRAVSGANSDQDALGGDNGSRPEVALEATVTTDVTGDLDITITLPACGFYSSFVIAGLDIEGVTGGGATIDFDTLTRCIGTGLTETGGTGLGQGATADDPGTDPIPDPPSGGYPPPPVGGARPYGAFEIPPAGLGFWNSSIQQMSPSRLVNLINTARTASATLWLTGRWKAWLDGSGRFSFALWKSDIDAVYNDPLASLALAAAIADFTAFKHYLIDEPFHPTRYGGPISFATVERMCQYSRTLWPTWDTAIRVPATKAELTRHMGGLGSLWSQYSTNKGDVTAFLARELDRAAALGHQLVIGVNIADFLGNETRPVTPDEYRHYGGILAASPDPVAFMSWRYETGLYTPAFVSADHDVRDILASNDP